MGVFSKISSDGKKIWYIDYYVDGLRKREKIGESKTQAKAVLAKRKGEIVSGKFKLKDAIKTPSFDKFAHDYLEWAKLNKKSWERDQDSIGHLARHFGAKRLSEIHTWHVEKYKRERMREVSKKTGKTPSPATVNRELACLKKMLSLAVRWDKALKNPAKSVELIRE